MMLLTILLLMIYAADDAVAASVDAVNAFVDADADADAVDATGNQWHPSAVGS